MQRVTISIDETLADAFDELVRARGYQSRSEGVRDLVREAVEAWRVEQPGEGSCVAILSYVYDRTIRALAQRLSDLQHDRHDLITSVTSTHLDHDHTLDSMLLRGPATTVRGFADQLRAERGVRFGVLNLIGVELDDRHHSPGAHDHAGHAHLSPHPG